MNNIDKIFVINLKHRTDRLTEFYEQLTKVGIPIDNIERFEAILHDIPSVGCCESHVAVLKLAKEKGWKNILIFEDDFDFLVSGEEFEKILQNFFEVVDTTNLDWRVVMLSYFLKHSKSFNSDLLGLTNNVQTSSGYLVNLGYIDELISCLEYGLNMLKKTYEEDKYAIDQVWKKLQQDDKWFYFLQRIGKQRSSYSDITKRIEDYSLYEQ